MPQGFGLQTFFFFITYTDQEVHLRFSIVYYFIRFFEKSTPLVNNKLYKKLNNLDTLKVII